MRRLVAAAVVAAVLALPVGVIAGHRFADVTASNRFAADIDAIAAAGVTHGCGDGRYCPSQPVTRDQLAAFLNRLGALGPGTTPVVNADRVDGHDASALARQTANGTSILSPIPDLPGETGYLVVSITAPANGVVVATANASISGGTCTVNCLVTGRIRHIEGAVHSGTSLVTAPANSWVNMSWTGAWAVSEGVNRFELRLAKAAASVGRISAGQAQMSLVFTPFRADGSIPSD